MHSSRAAWSGKLASAPSRVVGIEVMILVPATSGGCVLAWVHLARTEDEVASLRRDWPHIDEVHPPRNTERWPLCELDAYDAEVAEAITAWAMDVSTETGLPPPWIQAGSDA